MFTPADDLGVSQLDISGMTAALHVATARPTLELFAPAGRLLLVTTANRVGQPGVRGVLTTATAPRRWALVAVGTVELAAPVPVPDRGCYPDPVSTRQSASRLDTPFLPAQETS